MANLSAARERYIGRWQTAYARAAARLETELRSTGPEDTGRQNTETRVFPRGPFRNEVIIATPYATFVRDGTQAHEIRARSAKALKFEVGGVTIFRQSVQHPGTRPNPWYNEAVGKMAEFTESELRSLP